MDRLLPARRAARALRHAGGRRHRGAGCAAHALRPRSPRPGARHLRADPFLQRAGGDLLGPGRPVRLRAAVPVGPHRALHRVELPAVPRGDHRGRLRHRRHPLVCRHAHPCRHADPRRRDQPHDGGGARHQHPPALHAGVRLRRRARRAGRGDGRADLQRAARHGRADPDPGVRGHRHRRHRLDPRRAGRLDHRRRGRHYRTRVPQAGAQRLHLAHRGRSRRAGAGLDPHLPADGRRAYLPAAGVCSPHADEKTSYRLVGARPSWC